MSKPKCHKYSYFVIRLWSFVSDSYFQMNGLGNSLKAINNSYDALIFKVIEALNAF